MSDVEENKLSVLSHLSEFRKRVIRSVIAVVIASLIAFIFAKQLFHILTLPAGGVELVYIEMTEMIGTYMKVCLAGGLVLAIPYVIYQGLMFVSPALTRREKKYVFVILPWIALMFVGGVVFGYFILLPPATKFLLTFGSDIAVPQIRVGNYISIVTRLLLTIGFAFEMPIIITFLSKIGIIKPKWLSDRRKTAFISAFIIAAIITPTFDPINQSLVALPLIILYELSILLAKLIHKKEANVVTSTSPTS